ncbi:9180_t:CDS:2 [Diversispora eburnea]|uniref:glutathione transferase n=2 Tax=Diversisporales TaxID=214509 RepID=A0A9N8ZX78_9GLOM|nr:9180_t:CDS:2 [Diversispora eburnea]CAG8664773.1 13215_t:CDS:2 [Dentiscutata erythropus]
MTIKLIGFHAAVPTLRVITTLNELGVPFEFSPIKDREDFKSNKFFVDKNPFGKVPILIDDGYIIYESRAISRYLVTKYQGKYNDNILIPDDIQKVATIDQHISIEGFYYDTPISTIIFQEIYRKKIDGTGPDPEVIKNEREKLAKTLNSYEKILEGQKYLTGNDVTLADILHYPATVYIISKGYGDLWESRPNVKRWVEDLSKREVLKEIKNRLVT